MHLIWFKGISDALPPNIQYQTKPSCNVLDHIGSGPFGGSSLGIYLICGGSYTYFIECTIRVNQNWTYWTNMPGQLSSKFPLFSIHINLWLMFPVYLLCHSNTARCRKLPGVFIGSGPGSKNLGPPAALASWVTQPGRSACWPWKKHLIWLVVSIPLENMSQLGW